MSTTLTIKIGDKTKKRLDRLAETTTQTKSSLVESALERFLDVNEWQIKETQKTLRKADLPNAKFTDHDDVSAWLDSWGTGSEKKPPRCD